MNDKLLRVSETHLFLREKLEQSLFVGASFMSADCFVNEA